MTTTESPIETTAPARPALAAPPAPRPRRRRRWGRWVAALLVVAALAAGGLWAWQRRASAAEAKPAGEVVRAERTAIERSVESSGTVAANLEVEIKCRASGEVTELPVDVSDAVKQGDLLCQLDPQDQELAVRSTRAAVAQSQARLAQAKAALEEARLALVTNRDRSAAMLTSAKVRAEAASSKADRQRQLVDAKLGSAEELEASQADAAAATADLRGAEVAVEELKQQEVAITGREQDVKLAEAELEAQNIGLSTAERNLKYTTVLAPLDGVIASRSVQEGSIVASGISNVSGGTTIMTLLDMSRVFVLATVDESDIGGVQDGQAARVEVDSYPRRAFEGRVTRVSPQGVSVSNIVTFEVKVEVTDADKGLLKPAMTGNVTIVEASKADALTVPVAAVSRRGAEAFVTLASGEKKPVTLGLEGPERTEIASGLADGDEVRVGDGEAESRWRKDGDAKEAKP